MSNYTESTNFTALTTAHAVINGAAFDLEYGNVATAIATKFDNLTAGYIGPFQMLAAAGKITLTINGAAGVYAVNIASVPTAGQSNGLTINAGTNSSDSALAIFNVTGSSSLFIVRGDGGVQVGNAGLTDEGIGTINVTGGYYVNGVPVSSGAFSPVLKQKATTTNRASTTTLTNDPDLTYAITAAGTYRVQVCAGWSTNSGSQGINANLNYSGTLGNSLAHYEVFSVTGVASPSVASLSTAVSSTVTGAGLGSGAVDNGGIYTPFMIDAVFVASTAGTVAFAWAQDFSAVTNLGIDAGSYMIITRLA